MVFVRMMHTLIMSTFILTLVLPLSTLCESPGVDDICFLPGIPSLLIGLGWIFFYIAMFIVEIEFPGYLVQPVSRATWNLIDMFVTSMLCLALVTFGLWLMGGSGVLVFPEPVVVDTWGAFVRILAGTLFSSSGGGGVGVEYQVSNSWMFLFHWFARLWGILVLSLLFSLAFNMAVVRVKHQRGTK